MAPFIAATFSVSPATPEPVPPTAGALPVGGFDCPYLRGFPLLCPLCGGQMRLIAFITEGTEIRKILEHIGVDSQAPSIALSGG